MAGETDLRRLIATLDPVLRPGEYVMVTRPGLEDATADALIREDEGVTHVVPRASADARGWPHEFVAAWITLRVHSSLAAVGLTAAVASVLARDGISCNVSPTATFRDAWRGRRREGRPGSAGTAGGS